jgi:hypothetical protein
MNPPRAGLGPGIDVRGPGRRRGGYLAGPGSIVDGTTYVITRDAAIAPLPAWLAALLDPAVDPAIGNQVAPAIGSQVPRLRQGWPVADREVSSER